MEIAAVKAALFFFLIFWVYFCIILILLKESFQGISEETCWKLLHWSSWQPGPLCYTSLSIEVNSMKWCQEALTEHVFMYPVSLCSSSFLPRQLRNWAKLRYTVRCCMGTTKKAWCLLYGGGSVELEIWNVSVGGHWASAEINPLLQILTPGVYSWRRAEIVPAPLLAWWSQARERTGTQHPVWSFWGCYWALLFCPPAGVTEGAARGTHSVMLGLWEGNLQFHGRMAQSSALRRWEESKVAATTGIAR